MPQRIAFIGNAQAASLQTAWIAYMPFAADYETRWIHYLNYSDDDAQAVADADVIILQVSDQERFEIEDLPRRKIIRYPYVNGAFLWPYCGFTHPDWGSTRMHAFSVFAGECGDAFLGQMYNQKMPAAEAAERYASLDISKVARLDRRFELTLDTQRLRDEKAGFDTSVADFIRDNVNREILFHSRQKLGKSLFWEVARPVFGQLLRMLGENEARVAEAERLDHTVLWGQLEVPMHPAIARHFAIPGRFANYRYRVNKTRLTFDEYSLDYMRCVFQEDIYDGIRLIAEGRHEEALPVLSRGFQASPRSPDAAAALSEALAALGRDQEALDFACAAVHLDSENRDLLAMLSNRYQKAGMARSAEAALKRALDIHPAHIIINNTLAHLLVSQGKRGEAIALLSMLAAGLPTNRHAQIYLAHLLLEEEDFDGSELLYRRIIEHNPEDGDARHQLHEIQKITNRVSFAAPDVQTDPANRPAR